MADEFGVGQLTGAARITFPLLLTA